MKWMPDVPDCWKSKPGQQTGPCHHFGVELVKPDATAKKDCPMCKGKGRYTALHVGEYDEMPVSMKCACTNKEARKL